MFSVDGVQDEDLHQLTLMARSGRVKHRVTSFCLCCFRIEAFSREEVDLRLATSLEFNTPLADLSDVKTMMDSINVVPGPIQTTLVRLNKN